MDFIFSLSFFNNPIILAKSQNKKQAFGLLVIAPHRG
jgi:hypothetical protein